MHNSFDQTTILKTLSKTYVFRELRLDPKSFTPTPDTAWITIAGRLLQEASAGKKPFLKAGQGNRGKSSK